MEEEGELGARGGVANRAESAARPRGPLHQRGLQVACGGVVQQQPEGPRPLPALPAPVQQGRGGAGRGRYDRDAVLRLQEPVDRPVHAGQVLHQTRLGREL